ncbi:MAG: hypothetical protein ACK41W_09830, partial [Cyanobacteriota bacterium]
ATPDTARLQRLRGWLLSRPATNGPAPSTPQTWQFAVNPQGEVVAATPVEGTGEAGRARLGLPSAPVPEAPAGDTVLIRGVLNPSGVWELAPWHGW